MAQAATSKTANQMIARVATPPASALEVAEPTPVTSRPNTSGTTVMVRASSHSCPIGAVTASSGSNRAGGCPLSAAPAARPTSKPSRMRVDSVFHREGRGTGRSVRFIA